MRFIFILLFLCLSAWGQITKNIVTDFGATCNGSGDDSSAFIAARSFGLTWQMTNVGLYTLVVPPGSVCMFPGTLTYIGLGLKNFLVSGYGASFSDAGMGNGYEFGGIGVFQDGSHSARLATVSSGASSVTLLTPAQASLFTVGTYALIAGIDMQGYGFPPNPYFHEYVYIQSIVGAVITFSAPLQYSYESTWPMFNAGGPGVPDYGGPGTLYVLPASWDTTQEYDGLSLSSLGAPNAQGRSITFKDITVGSGGCIFPSQNSLFALVNPNISSCFIEADKIVDTFSITGGTIAGIAFQSASIKQFTMSGVTSNGYVTGTPINTSISNSTLSGLFPGAYVYGPSSNTTCLNCAIATMGSQGVIDQGIAGVGVNVSYTMSNGVITVPISMALPAVPWAVPGAQLFWAGQYANEGVPFKVVDVTQSGSNVLVQTTLQGGFPALPLDSGKLYLHVHPSPQFTCANCTGDPLAVDLAQAPPGAPIFSYSKRTYSGNIGHGLGAEVWGRLVSLKYNVTKPYTGVQSTLTLNAVGQNGTFLINLDGTAFRYTGNSGTPSVNLKTSGQRAVFPDYVTGQQSGDSGLSIPGPLWWAFGTFGPYLGTDISGENPSVYPSVTIEIVTDQTPAPQVTLRGTSTLRGKAALRP